MKFPKKLLIHNFDYLEYAGENRNHIPEFKKPINIQHARIDFISGLAISKREELDTSECIIFCIKQHTKPFVDFKEKSKVRFRGKELTVHKVIPIYDPYTNELFSYELELI